MYDEDDDDENENDDEEMKTMSWVRRYERLAKNTGCRVMYAWWPWEKNDHDYDVQGVNC
jgi:hypothetical protein